MISNKVLMELVYEQYRHDKLTELIEDSLDNGLFNINDIVLNDSKCLFILLDLLGIDKLNDKIQDNIFIKYREDILYKNTSNLMEDLLLNAINEYVIWLKEYIKKEML